jgi:hypothetical protein
VEKQEKKKKLTGAFLCVFRRGILCAEMLIHPGPGVMLYEDLLSLRPSWKPPAGRAKKRMLYTRRFVNAVMTVGGKRKMNSNEPSTK